MIYGAISQSGDGSSDLMWDYHADENRNQVFASTGCTDSTGSNRLECLRGVSVRDIQKSVDPIRFKYREWQWGIVLDNDFYTDRCGYSNTTNIDADKCYQRVSNYNFMSGCCSADGYGFAPSWVRNEGTGTLDKFHSAISDYLKVYDYKDETYSGISYAYTSKGLSRRIMDL